MAFASDLGLFQNGSPPCFIVVQIDEHPCLAFFLQWFFLLTNVHKTLRKPVVTIINYCHFSHGVDYNHSYVSTWEI